MENLQMFGMVRVEKQNRSKIVRTANTFIFGPPCKYLPNYTAKQCFQNYIDYWIRKVNSSRLNGGASDWIAIELWCHYDIIST